MAKTIANLVDTLPLFYKQRYGEDYDALIIPILNEILHRLDLENLIPVQTRQQEITVEAGAAWEAETAYQIDDIVQPTEDNDHYYICTVAGTSDETEPTWPTDDGDTVTDGTVTWQEYGLEATVLITPPTDFRHSLELFYTDDDGELVPIAYEFVNSKINISNEFDDEVTFTLRYVGAITEFSTDECDPGGQEMPVDERRLFQVLRMGLMKELSAKMGDPDSSLWATRYEQELQLLAREKCTPTPEQARAVPRRMTGMDDAWTTAN